MITFGQTTISRIIPIFDRLEVDLTKYFHMSLNLKLSLTLFLLINK